MAATFETAWAGTNPGPGRRAGLAGDWDLNANPGGGQRAERRGPTRFQDYALWGPWHIPSRLAPAGSLGG